MSEIDITLEWLTGRFAVCRFDPSASTPGWALAGGGFVSITHSERELSIVAAESIVPAEVTAERGWAVMRVVGKLDFSIVGLLAKLTGALAEAGISCFAISTYDTDYVLVKEAEVQRAEEAIGKVSRIAKYSEDSL